MSSGKKDYYAILGVARDADCERIRKAYREKARETHPDCGGQAGRDFLEVQEAYENLRDPAKRSAYDRGLNRVSVTVFRESAFPSRDSLWNRPGGGSLFEILDRLFEAPLPGGRLRKRERAWSVDLVLSPHERRTGIRVLLEVPYRGVCSRCRGLGRQGLWPCTACGGLGRVGKTQPVVVDIPAGAAPGRELEFDLQAVGLDGRLVCRICLSGEDS